jgi:hypothetical protein
VQADVEKGEKAKHAAETNEVGKLEKLAERGDAQSEDDEADGPVSGAVLKSFDGIDSEIILDQSPEQIGERNQADQEDGDFGPFAD